MRSAKVKTRVGIISSDKMDKTVVVDVMRTVRHSRFNKPIKRTKKFKAHDERNECRVGDKVYIVESRPLSKTKRWRVSKIIERGLGAQDVPSGASEVEGVSEQ